MSDQNENAQRRVLNDKVIDEFRANGGKVGGSFEGVDLLLLHHVGGRSGQAYISPLSYFRTGDRFVTTGANGGRAWHPSWYFNLKTNPETRIEVGDETRSVRAREADGAEREALLERARTTWPYFADFENATTRRIPIFVLESED